jgi:hypothetical protein
MGAWGTGPFDSDGGLDYLGDVEAAAGARRDDDGKLDLASFRADAVHEELRRALAMDDGAAEAVDAAGWYDHAARYAAAGLVAARLTGQPSANIGTRLLDRLAGATGSEDLGLDRHCGYLELLDQDSAERLRDNAVAAVAALRADESWLDSWSSSRNDVMSQLDNLARELAPDRRADRLPERELGPEPEL